MYDDFFDKLFTENESIANELNGQLELRGRLLAVSNQIKSLKKGKEKIAGKEKFLRKEISRSGGEFDMTHFDPMLPLPLKPNLLARGAEPTKCSVFTSALAPLRMSFYVEDRDSDGGPAQSTASKFLKGQKSAPTTSLYSIMFKNGDDVRQDQLVLQLIDYMDSLLK